MPGGTRLALLAVVALAVSATIATAPAGAVESGATAQDVDADTIRIQVTVHPNGTAEWRVQYRVHLDSDEREAAFESLQADIREDPEPFVSDFVDTLSPSVERAADQTGRDMALRNASVKTGRAALARPTGTVTYRFMWTNFAAREDDRLLVGDALSGFYVGEDTTLRIEWPANYEVASLTPAPDDRSANAAVWNGPTDFGSEEPRIELTEPGLPVSVPLAAAAALLVAATLGMVVRARGTPATEQGGTEREDGSRGGGGGGEAGMAAGGPTDDGSPPMELLSNEERVIAVLEANGGRMKQQAIAAELEWDAPKTSRVVNGLKEEGAVNVFRLGRENVVTLPEEELL